MLRPDSTPGPPGCGVEHRRARRPRLRRALQLFARASARLCRHPQASRFTLAFPVPLPLLFAVGCSNVYGNIHEITCLAMAAVFRRRRITSRSVSGASNSPRGFGRCTSASCSLLWRRLVRPEDDFYGPPESKEFFEPFLEALGIHRPRKKLRRDRTHKRRHRQTRGISAQGILPGVSFGMSDSGRTREPAASTIARLASNAGPANSVQLQAETHCATRSRTVLPWSNVKSAGIGPILTWTRA